MTPTDARRTRFARSLPALVGLLTLIGCLAWFVPEGAADEKSRPNAVELSRKIDSIVTAKLESEELKAAPRSDDAEFLRRIYLDLLSTVPTAEEVERFTRDRSRDKRARKIEELLGNETYSDRWGMWWYRTLTGLSAGARPGRGGDGARFLAGTAGQTFHAWLSEQMENERPYDEFVEDLLTATGRTDENGATGYYARWQGEPNNLAGAVSKHFLGLRIQCAQCHDHIYEETWKQSDFKGMAAFFARTRQRRVPEYREFQRLRREMEQERQKKGGNDSARPGRPGMDEMDGDSMDGGAAATRRRMRELASARNVVEVQDYDINARQVARARRFMRNNNQGNEQLKKRMELLAVTPKLWHASESPDLPGISRRYILARWITGDENPYFAKALVNRYWGHFMGTGIVHPIDDFSSFNEASHPEILDLLAEDFVTSGYDLKRVIRILANTETYQRTSRWTGKEEPDASLFAKAPVRPLSTEQLYFSLLRATGIETTLDRRARRMGRGMQQQIFSMFSFVFDDDEEKEVSDFEGSIPQGLFLMNGELLQRVISAGRRMPLNDLLRNESSDAKRVDRLYLSVFGRKPTANERRSATYFISRADGESPAYEDLLWAMLNSAEFMTNH